MRCFTTCPIANFASRIGGWTIADRASWFLSSMAEVLLRTRQQATRSTGEFTASLQEYAKSACWMYTQEHCHDYCGLNMRPASVDASGWRVDSAPQGLLGKHAFGRWSESPVLGRARFDFLLRCRIYALWRQHLLPGGHCRRPPTHFRRRHRHSASRRRSRASNAGRYRHLFHPHPPRPHLGPHLLLAAVRQGQRGAPVGGSPGTALYAEERRQQPDEGAALSGVAGSLPGA